MTGIEELRRVAYQSTNTRESAFDGMSAEECLRVMRAVWASPWDILPDALGAEERKYAAKNGKLSPKCLKRLERVYG